MPEVSGIPFYCEGNGGLAVDVGAGDVGAVQEQLVDTVLKGAR